MIFKSSNQLASAIILFRNILFFKPKQCVLIEDKLEKVYKQKEENHL